MIRKKQISIIIPCYNAEKYIKTCIESLINQTIGLHNMEIIIIDDASTDSSREQVLRYEKLYSESIFLISLDKNLGQANARNIGIEMSSGEYLTFVDADDWVEPDIYEKMMIPARKYHCDLIQCAMTEFMEGNVSNCNEVKIPEKMYQIYSVEDRKCFLKRYTINGMIGCSIYRRAYIEDNRFRFKSFSKYEDNYWAGLIKYSFETYYPIHDSLYYYRIQVKSNSHARNDIRHFERLKVELEKLSYYQEEGLFETYYFEIRNEFLEMFYAATLHIICCQFDYVPIEQIEMMKTIVKEIYPDYLEYCRESERFINPVLTVAFDFPLEIWEEYKSAYYLWVSKGKEEKITKFYLKMRQALSI